MLQLPNSLVDPLIRGTEEPSLTPSVEILGVKVHSGDILVVWGAKLHHFSRYGWVRN